MASTPRILKCQHARPFSERPDLRTLGSGLVPRNVGHGAKLRPFTLLETLADGGGATGRREQRIAAYIIKLD
jgi:hypothetical protein